MKHPVCVFTQKYVPTKLVISKNNIVRLLKVISQENMGVDSPGVGVYSPNIDKFKTKSSCANFGTGTKYDEYAYKKEIFKYVVFIKYKDHLAQHLVIKLQWK
jgi:hypothetical protein